MTMTMTMTMTIFLVIVFSLIVLLLFITLYFYKIYETFNNVITDVKSNYPCRVFLSERFS